MVSPEEGFRHRLLDPGFWRPRLAQMTEVPRQLALFARNELCRPGIEVQELRLRAHDGAPLRALLARSAFHREGGSVRLRLCTDFVTCALDWRWVEGGSTDVVFQHPPGRRLEDRVLDVLRLIEAVASVEKISVAAVQLHAGLLPVPDEFVLANLVRSQAWATA